ncbi:hypothetical protein FRC03_004351 [Tulasnella sp. 419]|nr:hypothetical protein FRC03_004351 [Tulasnella sp. 419]
MMERSQAGSSSSMATSFPRFLSGTDLNTNREVSIHMPNEDDDEASASLLEGFKVKVLSRRGGYNYVSDDFLNEVVRNAMQEYGVEGLIWQMATDDPMACDASTRRNQRWYLRLAVSKWGLGPEKSLPAHEAPKARLASTVFKETRRPPPSNPKEL